MAVSFTVDIHGETNELLKSYNDVIEDQFLEPRPHGLIEHQVVGTETGIRIVEIWETQEDLEADTRTEQLTRMDRLTLAVQRAGFSEPTSEVIDISDQDPFPGC